MPQYDGLALKHIALFLTSGYEYVWDYMPDAQEIHKVPKEWICNGCATVLRGLFTGWVKNQIEARDEKVTRQQDLMIEMDAEVLDAFSASTSVSRKHIMVSLS